MIEDFGQIAVGGILALLVLREVFTFLRTRNGRGRPVTGPASLNLSPVVDRLDRMLEKQDEAIEITKAIRKQTELNGEMAERQNRNLDRMDTSISRLETSLHRRPTGPIARIDPEDV